MSCANLSDGDYPILENQCLKQFWRCTAGQITGRACKDGKFFNAATKRCEAANNIIHCKIFDEKCQKSQVYDSARGRCSTPEFVPNCASKRYATFSTNENEIEILKIIWEPELNDFCSQNGDGMFSAGCEEFFYLCTSGTGYYVNCLRGLYFDSAKQMCTVKDRVLLCKLLSDKKNSTDLEFISSKQTVAAEDKDNNDIFKIHDNVVNKESTGNFATDIPEVGISAMIAAPIPKDENLPFLPEDFECERKNDGFYSIGCENEFVACVNSRMFFFKCPQDLIFDEESQTCNYVGNINKCLHNSITAIDKELV
ncbi:unnamed protein product [Thelazia callipaeda]|uniref:Chitin-binding type-2 domain-containing protein n=1 Tax=Thelazia callipaeda TaxID=103827 RepID=A0A0N5CZ75_THECL|nr:unnamed protein product [Thelazia callipaeda]